MNAARFLRLSNTEIFDYINRRRSLLRHWYYTRPRGIITRLDTRNFQVEVLGIPHGFNTKTGKFLLKLPKIELVWGLFGYTVYITNFKRSERIKISIPPDLFISVSKYKYVR